MKILLDGNGGDNAPKSVVEGAVLATEKIDHQLIIIGKEDEIKKELKELGYEGNKIQVVHASEKIENEDNPSKAFRVKKDSSIVKGLNMIKAGEADLFISAGNTGALMVSGIFILGRIPGIDRPAIGSVYPILGKDLPALLIDAGANAECKPNNLLEFAMMGNIYMEKVLGINSPKIGLVNMGTEENKGTPVIKETFKLLEKSDMNFVGNVEAREVPKGACDVIVCDGFVGNVILKLTEGLASNISALLKKKFTEGVRAKVGAVFLLNKMKEIRQEFDYSEYGGAPILGVQGPIVKMHGSSTGKAVSNAIVMAVPFIEGKVVETIKSSVSELERIEYDISE